jgi:hypothetical protein
MLLGLQQFILTVHAWSPQFTTRRDQLIPVPHQKPGLGFHLTRFSGNFAARFDFGPGGKIVIACPHHLRFDWELAAVR